MQKTRQSASFLGTLSLSFQICGIGSAMTIRSVTRFKVPAATNVAFFSPHTPSIVASQLYASGRQRSKVSRMTLTAHIHTMAITTATLMRNERLLPNMRKKKSMIEVLTRDMAIPYNASSGKMVLCSRMSFQQVPRMQNSKEMVTLSVTTADAGSTSVMRLPQPPRMDTAGSRQQPSQWIHFRQLLVTNRYIE